MKFPLDGIKNNSVNLLIFLWIWILSVQFQGHQAGLEKSHLARKPGIIFQSREILKNKTNFLISMCIFTNFDKYMSQKSAHFTRNCVLWC